MIAVIAAHIADELAALEQELAAVEVADEGVRLLRPSDLRVEVRAGEIFLARQPHLRRRAGERVPEDQVQPGARLVIEARLLLRPQRVAPLRADRGEALGAGDRLAVDVRGGGGLLDEEARLVGRPVRRGHPELAHRHRVEPEVLERVEARAVRAAGLRLDA